MQAKDVVRQKKIKCLSRKELLSNSIALAKNVAATIEEMVQGGSVAYSTYLVLTYNPELEGKYGYGLVALGIVGSGLTEIMHINAKLSLEQHHNYRIMKEAIAGAMVAGLALEERLSESTQTVLIGGTVAIVLTASKVLLEKLREKEVFNTKTKTVFQYVGNIVYSSMMAAGIADYLFAICKGFGAEVDLSTSTMVTLVLVLANVFADLPLTKSIESEKNHPCEYQLGRVLRSGMWGTENTLFLTILLFDLITNIEQSDDISNQTFGLVLLFTILQGFITCVYNLVEDKKERAVLHHHSSELKPLVAFQEKSKETKLVKKLTECCVNFWNRRRAPAHLPNKNNGDVNYEAPPPNM